MYQIYLLRNGTYQCVCRVQDGTERMEYKTKEEAIANCISFAKVMNGTVITQDQIPFYREVQVIETKWERYDAQCSISNSTP